MWELSSLADYTALPRWFNKMPVCFSNKKKKKIMQDPCTLGRRQTANLKCAAPLRSRRQHRCPEEYFEILWNRWLCPGFDCVPPGSSLWQIVKYSFLCDAPSASRPTKIKPVKQTARSPRGVISAAVDGCSAADMPVNHGRNSLKRPRKKKKKKKNV